MNIFLSFPPAAYKPFFDNDWATQVAKLSEGDQKLDKLVINLLLNWRSAIYSASAPYFLADGLAKFHGSFVEAFNPAQWIDSFAPALQKRLVDGIPEIEADSAIMAVLSSRIKSISADFSQAFKKDSFRLSLDEVWESYLMTSSFQMMAWGCQQTCFMAIHCAYEDFLTGTVGIGKNNPKYSKPHKDEIFQKDICSIFGVSSLATVWTNDTLVNSRLARNCLAHASGKISKQLKMRTHNFIVEDDRIQITPKDLKEQTNSMKVAVTEVIKKLIHKTT